jgi:hypothetical protein
METLLPGLHGAPNAHPVFLHFPLVLLVTACAFAVIAALRASDDLARFSQPQPHRRRRVRLGARRLRRRLGGRRHAATWRRQPGDHSGKE